MVWGGRRGGPALAKLPEERLTGGGRKEGGYHCHLLCCEPGPCSGTGEGEKEASLGGQPLTGLPVGE